jgi:paraquat-inducible protein B
MSDIRSPATATAALAHASVGRRRRISLVWAIPFVTLLVGAYLAYDTLSKRGPTIDITFDGAEGLVAGTSHVQHRGIDLGIVRTITLTKGAKGVLVTVQMNREADPLLTEGAKLWVVEPRLFAGSISGLGTLLSGSYLELLPGAENGAKVRHFTGLEDPPVLQTDVPGETFLLKADRIGSVSVGSPIFYRDLSVGVVLGWDIGQLAKDITIHAFVRAPYDQYVRPESRFWNASGLSVKLGAEGVQVQFESLKALLLGGVEFETPDLVEGAPKVAVTGTFPLFANEEAARNAGYRRRVPFVSYFEGAVDGLAPGSPVTFQGLRVGEVTSIDLQYDPKRDMVVAPVHYLVQPERIGNVKVIEGRGPLENTKMLVERGLRAELKSTNLITGQMSVALEIVPNADPAELTMEGDVIVMPSVAGGLAGITNSVNQLLSKLNNMPFQQIGASLAETLRGASKVANSADGTKALASLQGVMTAAQQVLVKVDSGAGPALRDLPGIARDLEVALSQASKTLASVNSGYGDDSKFRSDLTRTMLQLNDTIRSIRVLADLLSRHPEALVRGRTDTGQE